MEIISKLISHIETTYHALAEHPWEKSPENMIFRDMLSGKWFALIMPVQKEKLGLSGNDYVYVINLKSEPDFIGLIAGTPGYFSGYHMNKQHWLTILLDGTVAFDDICDHIETSYKLITDTPSRRIYEAVKRIPYGKVATYGQVAAMAGNEKMSRAVGNALHKNPDPDNIPCYRVVNSKGELAGEFAFGGSGAQAKLLEAEGITVTEGKVDLKKFGI